MSSTPAEGSGTSATRTQILGEQRMVFADLAAHGWDVAVPAEAVLGLERRGWRRSRPMDAGIQGCVFRELPGGLCVKIKLNPGISIGQRRPVAGGDPAGGHLDVVAEL